MFMIESRGGLGFDGGFVFIGEDASAVRKDAPVPKAFWRVDEIADDPDATFPRDDLGNV